jgi:hypothetical protein
VAHYGLPAAGIILLAILKQRQTFKTAQWSRAQVWQQLSILVGEIQMGTIVQPGDPNYALFSKATQTIQRCLDTVRFNEIIPTPEMRSGQLANHAEANWALRLSPDIWNLDFEVWENLSVHPFFSDIDAPVQV